MQVEFNLLGEHFEGCKNAQGMDPALFDLKKVMVEHLVRVHPSMRTRTMCRE